MHSPLQGGYLEERTNEHHYSKLSLSFAQVFSILHTKLKTLINHISSRKAATFSPWLIPISTSVLTHSFLQIYWIPTMCQTWRSSNKEVNRRKMASDIKSLFANLPMGETGLMMRNKDDPLDLETSRSLFGSFRVPSTEPGTQHMVNTK